MALAPRIAELERELPELAGGGEDDAAVHAYLDDLLVRVPVSLAGHEVAIAVRIFALTGRP